MSLFNRSAKFLSTWKTKGNRPPFESFYVYALALMTGYMVADLSILAVRPKLLPTQPPPMKPSRAPRYNMASVDQYSPIAKRNILNSDGKIPPALIGGDGGEEGGVDAAPVASSLPLKLEGTMVHANPRRSVATITSKSKNEASAYMVDTVIDGMAKVTMIERRKVIFRNQNNQRLEFIEIPKDSAVSFGVKETAGSDEVQKKSEFEFTMRRADINKYTANLGDILQQARMVPYSPNGKIDGFKFVSIQPGSIYEKLGFKTMDVIKMVNGEPVNSPTKAMELYNSLRTESRIELKVERNGRDENFTYTIPD